MEQTSVPMRGHLLPTSGTLSDADIRYMCSQRTLIVGDYSESNIKQCCYELRASRIYYQPPDARRIELEQHQYILVKPRQLIVVIAQEKLELPNNILGRVLTKGKLFSIGLLPVNTYADPGFRGQLGIVFCNLTNSYLKLRPGDPIAKIEFSRLEHSVEHSYSGQHGYQSEMWPIPTELILTPEEVSRDSRIGSPESEIQATHGSLISGCLARLPLIESRLARLERRLYWSIGLSATLAFLFLFLR